MNVGKIKCFSGERNEGREGGRERARKERNEGREKKREKEGRAFFMLM